MRYITKIIVTYPDYSHEHYIYNYNFDEYNFEGYQSIQIKRYKICGMLGPSPNIIDDNGSISCPWLRDFNPADEDQIYCYVLFVLNNKCEQIAIICNSCSLETRYVLGFKLIYIKRESDEKANDPYDSSCIENYLNENNIRYNDSKLYSQLFKII